jgi:hypothetical protein
MGKFISVTSIDGSMAIVNVERIISCVTCNIYDEAAFENARLLWGDNRDQAWDDDSDNAGKWEVANPQPKKEDHHSGGRMTVIEVADDGTSIRATDTTEEIYEKIQQLN